MVKVGLVGVGFMGHMHYNIYKQHAGARLVALCDHQRKRREGRWEDIAGNIGEGSAAAEDLRGINTYADPQDLIADPQVELVDICLPTDLHSDVAISALQAGKHVFVEKPMARSVKQGQAILKAAEKAKGYLMVGHCIRFWPEYQVAYDLIRSKKYGRVKEAFFRRVSSTPRWSDKNWLLNNTRSGGSQWDLHIHDVDYMLYLLGMPASVYATGQKGPSKGIDSVQAVYNYPGRLTATVLADWSYQGDFPFNMEFCIRCDKATLAYSMQSGQPLTVYTDDGKQLQPQLPTGGGYEREIDYFLNCIEQKKKPRIVTAKSSLETLRVLDRELKSIETGRIVKLK